jgi:GMP synthase-like glutamine amidotransferase
MVREEESTADLTRAAMTPLRIRVFQHVPFEDIGSMDPWARGRGHRVERTRFHAGDAPPPADAYDWLIVMGGPMGARDEDRLPWMAGEKRAIEAALSAGKAVLGICLGAQLIADVLGAEVRRNRHPEIGWFPVTLSPDALRGPLADAFPPSFTAFHWHGDTFAIPAGAVPLGSSAACDNQGFLIGDRVLALQFHPEVTSAGMEDLLRACGHELRPGPFVQDAAAIRAGIGAAPGLNAMMDRACGLLERALIA